MSITDYTDDLAEFDADDEAIEAMSDEGWDEFASDLMGWGDYGPSFGSDDFDAYEGCVIA